MMELYQGTDKIIKVGPLDLPSDPSLYSYDYVIKLNKLFGETFLLKTEEDMDFDDTEKTIEIHLTVEDSLSLPTGNYLHELKIKGDKWDIVFQESLIVKYSLTSD